MAARKDNLLSLEHLTGPKRNTFTKRKEHRLKMSREMHLQQRWQELKERELTAQQTNRQLLQQFEEAQDSLKEMLTLTAAMKTIRMEYERYLEESCPRWQQQLKEKTQAAQRKRMEYLRSGLKNTEGRETASSADQPLLSHGFTTMNQNIAALSKHYSPNSHLDYNQYGSPHLSYVQSSWQTRPQSQTASFPIRAPYQPQGFSHVPPSFLQPNIVTHPHPLHLHHLASSPGERHPRPRLNPPGWAALQPDYPWSWAAGAAGMPSGSEALWGQRYTEELPPDVGIVQVVGEETDTSPAPSSKRERGGASRSSPLAQELDIKPVRMSGGIAESSESTRESVQVSRENRKKREERGRSQCSSSDRQSCISQDSSRSSSAIVIAAVKVVQSSESDSSSEKGRTSTRRRMRRSGGLAVGSPRDEKEVKGSKGDEPESHKEESQSTSEEVGSLIEACRSENAENPNPDDKSERSGEESGSQKEEESGSVSIKIENGGGDEIEKQERSSSEQSNVGEKDEEDLDGEEDENSQTDGEQEERDGEDHEASERKNATEEDEKTGAEDEEQDEEDEEVDEDESNGGEDNMEDKESDEEEPRGDPAGEPAGDPAGEPAGEPEEEGDSDDSIISPQDKSKKMDIISEEASEEDEEEEGNKIGSSDDSNEISDEDDVENLLAPEELSEKKEEKDPRADEQPKAICGNVETFLVEPDKWTKSDHHSDSEEFDDFYG